MTADRLAAGVFVVAMLLLAAGRVGRLPVRRGGVALSAGLVTALLLAIGPAAVDWNVIALLAGLMALAGLAEHAGLFRPLRDRLVRLTPHRALATAVVGMAAASALFLNDAAMVVLLPLLLPPLRSQGLEPVSVVVLLAVASNVGSLLTPFGNPQNAALAAAAGLSMEDFLLQQGPVAAVGLAFLVAVARCVPREVRGPRGEADGPAPRDGKRTSGGSRGPVLAAIALAGFLALAATAQWTGVPYGVAAVLAATALYLGLRVGDRAADRAVLGALDLNILALFVGLYLLTAGLGAWLPGIPLPRSLWEVGLVVAAAGNLVGNVPAVLVLLRAEPAWSVAHGAFLVTASTLGGTFLLGGSAVNLIAAESARRQGVGVGFVAFLRRAVPLGVPLFGFGLAWRILGPG